MWVIANASSVIAREAGKYIGENSSADWFAPVVITLIIVGVCAALAKKNM